MILENRALIDETARARARAEALVVAEAERSRVNQELEARVVERTSELQQALLDLESFSYSVSHDLRAPLRTIDGFSQALLEDHFAGLPSDGKDSLTRIRAACQRMGELIDGLLRLSRVTRAEFRWETVDLSSLVRSIVTELQVNDSQRHPTVIIEDNLVVEGDRELLRTALENLLSNAWKFTSKQAAPRIEFSATYEDDQRVFVVKDNGAGFDMAFSSKLFGPFQRLHRRDEFEGTGIGLATVGRIIRRHGGRIWVNGVVGKGASFYFTLGTTIPTHSGGSASGYLGVPTP
jgi:light-regulated signal transduction histidine kinase (bacteriophytochrome)